jgi:hypothetical protein
MLILDATDDGLESLRPPSTGLRGGRPPGTGGAGGAPGGFGAEPRGGLGTELRDVSGSEEYGALLCSAPVLTPPAFLSFGMPPANIPASCGGAAIPLSPAVSLLLRARFPPGGASPPGGAGGLPMPGTGGAPVMAGADGPSETLPTMGDERSLITVTFFRRAPLPMSDSSAPCAMLAVACPMRLPHHAARFARDVNATYSSCSRRRLSARRLHARHWRRRRWPSSAASHGRHGRRGRWWGHRVVCALLAAAVVLLLRVLCAQLYVSCCLAPCVACNECRVGELGSDLEHSSALVPSPSSQPRLASSLSALHRKCKPL